MLISGLDIGEVYADSQPWIRNGSAEEGSMRPRDIPVVVKAKTTPSQWVAFSVSCCLSLFGCGSGGSGSQGTHGSGSQAPDIISVSPNPVPGSTSAQSLTITGTGFVSGAMATYQDPQGNTYTGHTTTFASASQIVDSAFNDANEAGTWKVTVINPGNTSSNTYSFTVTSSTPAPAITSVSPSPVPGSTSPQSLTINGTGFVSGATATYQDPNGKTYSGHATTFVSASQIVDTAFNDANESGTWTVTVINPGNTGSNTYSFTVTSSTPAPAITSVSPNPVPGSTSPQSLTINGSGFASGATATYQDPNGNTYTGHATTFVSASQIIDSAFNDANESGTWTVTVVNPNNTNSNVYSFTVTAGTPQLTFTVVQHSTSTCASSPCADQITSTTAGNLLVLWSAAQYSGTGTAIAAAFTGASGDGVWTHCPNQIVNDVDGLGTAYALDCWYMLSATGGATSVNANWTFAGLSSPSYAIADELFELQPSSTPIYYDTGNATNNQTTCSTTCTGPAALLSGTDAVLQAAMLSSAPSAISSPYAVPDILSNPNSAFSIALNQSAYAQPAWQTLSSYSNFFSTIAFGNNPNPITTLDYLIDFSACTPGSAPTATCLSNSTFTGANAMTPYLGIMGPNIVVTSSGPSSQLPFSPTIFNGLPRTGANTPNLGCTTSGSTHSCSPLEVGVNMVPTSISIGYTVESNCPATGVDCSAIGGIFSKDGVLDFDVVHFSPLGNGKICFETEAEAVSGPGCNDQTQLDYAPNTAYRVNMQINNYPATTNYITVCADGPGGAVLGTWSADAAAGNSADDVLVLGISGEEPAVAGYTYTWRNVAVSLTGNFSQTSCF